MLEPQDAINPANLNALFDEVDTAIDGIGTISAGFMVAFAGAAAPDGWLLCDGTAVSRTTYAALFAVIGTTFGVGNGSTTFNLPDLRGRTPIGAGQGSGLTDRTLGQQIGEEFHQLIVAEIPAHTHTMVGIGSGVSPGAAKYVSSNLDSTTGSTGNDGTHNNMQPSLVLNFLIKV